MTTIPTPETITAGWLTEQLRKAGHSDADVRAFGRTPVGTGQIGKCVRFDLDLARGGDEVPRSLIGKFPSDDPISRATGVQLRNYYREVRFYTEFADKVSIAIPRCYYADIIDEGPEFALLLQDMRPSVQGDQLAGCSVDVAQSAVNELVGLQAPTWCDDSLNEFDWLRASAGVDLANLRNFYAQTVSGFLERYGEHLDKDQIEIISAVATSPSCPLYVPPGDQFCLEHVDYRLDNMLIDTDRSPPRVTIVDWQSVKVGKPLNDVGYFLGAGLIPSLRREVEEDIVRDYHAAIRRAGVPDFDWSHCWDAYRRSTFAGFAVTVIASMIVQRTKRGDEMFVTMAQRHSRHALDLDAGEFLT